MEIRISVRSLVEFILRSGDIDNTKAAAPDHAMQEGSRIHRMLQRRMGADYHAEVPLHYRYDAGKYQIHVEGRADGIIRKAGGDIFPVPELPDHQHPPDEKDVGTVTVDEIKGTYRETARIREAVPVHLAQAKCYAYIYGSQNGLAHIWVRITYCNMDTEELKYFHFEYEMEELREWFEKLMSQYRKWADFQYEWQQFRQQSIKSLVFPFSYREGQKELVSYVYQTIYHKRKLFLEAPTGVGKTLSALFPAIKSMGEGKGERIFYLTAKTITRRVAQEALELMRKQRLRLKSVTLTAKEKICFMEETECNPGCCPYAKGHFDRINDAVYDLLTHADGFDRDKIEEYARLHQVCPFEMCLDMSLFSDVIICDYNYVFDPHVYLKRFFTEGVSEDYIFLIDEAHNLVERGREMYSAVLRKEDFLALKKIIKEYDGGISRQLDRCSRELLVLKRECQGYSCEEENSIAAFLQALMRLYSLMDAYLEEQEESPIRKELLEFYFEVGHFLMISEQLDEQYVIYTQLESDGGFIIKLFCVNPGRNLRECMMRGRSAILFSATLLPIQYYKKLLGAVEGDYEVYARSVFDPRRKGLFIARDVTSKYTRRSTEEYYRIADYIYRITRMRAGNYLVFFPSHAFLRQVYDIYARDFFREDAECILQEEYMDERSREAFLGRFQRDSAISAETLQSYIGMEIQQEESTLIGFCVLGGIFSEGIDLKNDSLIGAIVVGTGLPQVCPEREILKQYFDSREDKGFDYAYRYPGMNKVLQAAGRVIRTVSDVGIVVLLDERFLSLPYLRMFPREWKEYEEVTLSEVERRIERFWDEWL